jgi:hypothetical protein
VGLTEAEAIAQHGEGAIESYVSSFSPLEWSITDRHAELSSFAKVLVHKEQNNKVRDLDSILVCAFDGVSLCGSVFCDEYTHEGLPVRLECVC